MEDYIDYLRRCSLCYNLPLTYYNTTALSKEVAKYFGTDTTNVELLKTLADIDAQRAC